MSETVNTVYQPTDGLCYDPDKPLYWQPEALQKEITRVFEVCHGCRMCFEYCDSFPILFTYIDEKYDGDVRGINAQETAEIFDHCFQCKLCEVQCPYTPRDGHEFQLDFPKLVHRHRAIEGARKGFRLRDLFLGDPDAGARMARLSFGMANIANRIPIARIFMEKLLGIHRLKQLPEFAPQTFEAWAKKNGKLATEPGAEVVLFQTCFVQNNEPEIGRDTLEVLEKNGVDYACVPALKCCGMPAWEHGDLDSLRTRARHNVGVLLPFVQAGAKVLVINPTCSMMLRREYPELLEGSWREKAEQVAAAVMDTGEFLWSIRKEERFNSDFKSSPGEKVAYHAPCHLRAQGVGFKGRDLIKKIPGVDAVTVMECCGHNGTFAMTVEGFDESQRLGRKAFEGMESADAEVWSTDCPLAAIQFEQHAGKKPLHPMSVLARAYREDGFPGKPVDDNKGS